MFGKNVIKRREAITHSRRDSLMGQQHAAAAEVVLDSLGTHAAAFSDGTNNWS